MVPAKNKQAIVKRQPAWACHTWKVVTIAGLVPDGDNSIMSPLVLKMII